MNRHAAKRWSRLTKRDALLICIEMWEWVAEGGGRWKGEWPRMEYNGGDVPTMASDCPCCEYMCQGKGRECCIIQWAPEDEDNDCCSAHSPFSLWVPGRYDAPAYAKEIVKLAKAALAKLPK